MKYSKADKEWKKIIDSVQNFFVLMNGVEERIKEQKFNEIFVPQYMKYFIKWDYEIENNKLHPTVMTQINKFRK